MSNTIPVKKMEAADPGLGFELDLSTRVPLNDHSLQITLVVHDVYDHKDHRSVLTVDPPITDPLVSIVMPFGCAEYKAGNQYEIKLTVMYGTEELVNLDHNIYGQGGTFEYRVNRPFLPRLQESLIDDPDYRYLPSLLMPGDYLTSPNGRYILRLDFDGKLSVHDTYDNYLNLPIWSSTMADPSANSQGRFYAFLGENSDLYVYSGDPFNHPNNRMIWSAYNESVSENRQRYYPLNQDVYLRLNDQGFLALHQGISPNGTQHGGELYRIYLDITLP